MLTTSVLNDDIHTCIASMDAHATSHWGSAVLKGCRRCPALLHVLPAGSRLCAQGEEDEQSRPVHDKHPMLGVNMAYEHAQY